MLSVGILICNGGLIVGGEASWDESSKKLVKVGQGNNYFKHIRMEKCIM